MSGRYDPCAECLNRYNRQYSKDCDCDYAYNIKLRDSNIEDLNVTIDNLKAKLKKEESRFDRLMDKHITLIDRNSCLERMI